MGRVSGGLRTSVDPCARPSPTAHLATASFLTRTVAGWHTAFWAMLAIGVIIMLTAGLDGAQLVISMALVALLAATYAVVGGRPSAPANDSPATRTGSC